MPRYIKFGKKLINQARLYYENILQVNYPSLASATTSGFKTRSVSPKFANVLKQMLKSQNPSFDELDNLTEEDKDLLHELCSFCKSLHHFSIPAPPRSKNDKLLNEYRTLVGQITAGQNNDDVVKRLKVLLIQIRNKNLLPTNELNNALLELIELGY